MELTPEISQRLQQAMDNKEETGYTIHAKLGISATTVGNYLKGNVKNADNIKLKEICNLLEISMEWLQYGQDMVKTPDTSLSDGELKTENQQDILRQILIKYHSNEEQYKHICHKLENIIQTLKELKETRNNSCN